MKANCVMCGQEFEKRNWSQKACSVNCILECKQRYEKQRYEKMSEDEYSEKLRRARELRASDTNAKARRREMDQDRYATDPEFVNKLCVRDREYRRLRQSEKFTRELIIALKRMTQTLEKLNVEEPARAEGVGPGGGSPRGAHRRSGRPVA